MAERWQNPKAQRSKASSYWLIELPDGGALLTEYDLKRGRRRWVREGRPQLSESTTALKRQVAQLKARVARQEEQIRSLEAELEAKNRRLEKPFWRRLF